MSTSYSTYVGPYVRCAITTTAGVEPIDPWDVKELLSERLVFPTGDHYDDWVDKNHADIWYPNVRVPWRSGNFDTQACFSITEVATYTVAEEMRQFENFFASELQTLRDHYGADSVTMGWGIIQDCS